MRFGPLPNVARAPLCLRPLIAGFALLVASGVSAPAHAQDAAELSKARAAFQQAIELEQAGNWSAAVQRFREVGQVRMTPQVRFHIALCEEKLGRLVAALGGYELALGGADAVGAEFKSEVEQNIARLRQRIPKLVITRGAGAEAATIELNGVSVGEGSIGVEVPQDPGPHSVTAKASGFKPFEATVTLEEGQKQNVAIIMEPLPPEPEPVRPQQAPSKLKIVPYVVGGAGAATILASSVFLILRQSTASDLEDKCKGDVCPTSEKSTYSRLKTYHYATIVTFGAGVAAVGTAAALLVIDARAKKKQDEQPPQVSVIPTLSPGHAGATAIVRF
jgi:hypothetical protein